MEGFLLAIGFIGLTCALLSPLAKTGTLVALISFIFYFYLLGIASWIPFLLFTLGILLIVLEFLIPDFGIMGVLGGILLFFGLYYTTENLGLAIRDLSMAIVSAAAVIVFLVRSGYTSGRLNKFVLQTNLQTENEVIAEENDLVLHPGLSGKAYTPLRPSGKATFGDESSPIYDVLSAEGMIPVGSSIVIEKIQGSKILVRKQTTEGEE